MLTQHFVSECVVAVATITKTWGESKCPSPGNGQTDRPIRARERGGKGKLHARGPGWVSRAFHGVEKPVSYGHVVYDPVCVTFSKRENLPYGEKSLVIRGVRP